MSDHSDNANAPPPVILAVDCDGTLTKTDLLVEAALAFVAQHPLNILRLFGWLLRGRLFLKNQLAAHAPPPDAAILPYHSPLLDYLQAEKQKQRTIVLATAAHRTHAQAVADHVGLFDAVLATDDACNLKGAQKAQRLTATYGERGFDYIGDSRADIPVWDCARQVLAVNPPASARRRYPNATIITDSPRSIPSRLHTWRRALRLHHWLKNLLVFVALIGGHKVLSASAVGAAALAFVVFGLLASATYLINDLFDLPHDRRHPKKRKRPLAAGAISIPSAAAVGIVLLVLAFVLAWWGLPPAFTAAAAIYAVATLSYSFWLKRLLLVDVLVLSLLFTVRIWAGGAATGIDLSFWLLAFSIFVFLSLALLKRYNECRLLDADSVAGRAYLRGDATAMMMLGIAAGMISVFVLALYLDSDVVRARYDHPEMIWFALPLMIYWIARVWVLSSRQQTGDDPLLFAFYDKTSWVIGGCFLVLAYLAS